MNSFHQLARSLELKIRFTWERLFRDFVYCKVIMNLIRKLNTVNCTFTNLTELKAATYMFFRK